MLAAYRRAEQAVGASDPRCGLRWQLLAAIGKVESGQARGGQVDAAGTTLRPILGPVLDGNGFANISDTDGGAYDGDARYDRAVGPMQFIPSTWAAWGQDGNGDGKRDPGNVYDAALAAGRYLCSRHPRPAGGRGPRPGGAVVQPVRRVPADGALVVHVLPEGDARGPGQRRRRWRRHSGGDVSEADAQADAQADACTYAQPHARAHPHAHAEPDSYADSYAEPDSYAHPGAESHSHAQPLAHPGADPHSVAHAHPDSHGDPFAFGHPVPVPEADAEAHAHPVAHPHAVRSDPEAHGNP